MSKVLALILAAGEGSRVAHLYNEDEPVKPMLKVGKERLIEKALHVLDPLPIEKAVLSFPSEKYNSLHSLVEERGVKLLLQKAKQRKLPTLLELPYILLWQFHFSKDKEYLQSFDHILTLPSDLILNSDDLAGLVDLHTTNDLPKLKRRITILSRTKREDERGDIFLMEGDRILKRLSYSEPTPERCRATHQAGVYLFSKALLKNPLAIMLGMRYTMGKMYLTKNEWEDFGNPDNVERARRL